MPEENVLGELGKGYKIAIETLNEGRIGIGAQMLGLAEGAWEHAVELRQGAQAVWQARSREFQAVQFQLAEMATEIEAAKLMVYNAARLKDAGHAVSRRSGDGQAILLRRWPSAWPASAWRSSAATASCGIIRRRNTYRDAKIGKIYEGTSNMQLATIAKLVMK